MPIDPINNSPKYRKALPKLDTPETDRFAGMYGGNPSNYNPYYTNTGENKNQYQPNWDAGVSNDMPSNYNRDNYLQPFKENPDFYDRPKLTNPEEQTFYQKMGKGLKNLGNNILDNRSDIGQGLLYGADMLASNKNEYRQDMVYENAFRNRMQQDPLWDYNAMYGNNQPLIKAEEGAQVRKPGVQGMPIEIEGGEFLILPDGTAELARGPKHKNGGIPTILPDKSIVYSNKLSPHGSKETFAKIAKKQDFTTELKTLQNPFASEVAKTSAQRMYDRKRKTLSEIFQMQQIMNGNSSGQPKGMSQENEGSEQPPMNPNEAQTTMQNQPHGDMMAYGGLIEQEFRPVYTSNPNDPRFSNYPGEVLYGMGGPYYEPYNIQYGMGGMSEMYAMGGMPNMYAMGGGPITFGSNPVKPVGPVKPVPPPPPVQTTTSNDCSDGSCNDDVFIPGTLRKEEPIMNTPPPSDTAIFRIPRFGKPLKPSMTTDYDPTGDDDYDYTSTDYDTTDIDIPVTTTPAAKPAPGTNMWYTLSGNDKVMMNGKTYTFAEYDEFVKNNPQHKYSAQPNSVGYVYRPGKGVVAYSEGGVVDASVMKLVEFKDGGMYINPKNKGKFTAWAQSKGMSVQEAASQVMANKENYSPTTVKRANFAKNFGGKKFEMGGEYDLEESEIQDLIKQGYKIEYV